MTGPELGELVDAVDRAGLGATTHWSRRSGGDLSDVYEVVMADGRELIVKSYAPQWTWKQDKEVHVYGRLHDVADVTTPSVLAVEGPREPGGRAVTIMTKVPGTPLSTVVGSLDGPARRDVYRQVGSALRRVHGLHERVYGYVVDGVVDPVGDNESYMRQQFGKKIDELRRLEDDEALADAIADEAAAGSEDFRRCRRPVLCHNDLHEGNILVTVTGTRCLLEGVIDVENAVSADPLMDLAKTDCYSIRGDDDKLAGFHEGYGPLDVGADARLRLYRLYHALELFVWFSSQGRRKPLPSIRRDIDASLGPARRLTRDLPPDQ